MIWTGFGSSAVGSHWDGKESALSRVLVGKRIESTGAPVINRQRDGGCRGEQGEGCLDGSLLFQRLTATGKRTFLGIRLNGTGLECHQGPQRQVRGRLRQPSQSRRKVGKPRKVPG